jgi:hypothetical protein
LRLQEASPGGKSPGSSVPFRGGERVGCSPRSARRMLRLFPFTLTVEDRVTAEWPVIRLGF